MELSFVWCCSLHVHSIPKIFIKLCLSEFQWNYISKSHFLPAKPKTIDKYECEIKYNQIETLTKAKLIWLGQFFVMGYSQPSLIDMNIKIYIQSGLRCEYMYLQHVIRTLNRMASNWKCGECILGVCVCESVCGVWICYISKIDLRFRSSHPYINGAYECIIADEIMFDILQWKSNQIHKIEWILAAIPYMHTWIECVCVFYRFKWYRMWLLLMCHPSPL